MRISTSEKQFLLHSLQNYNIRPDGRQKLSYRSFNVEIDVIQQTNGSARVTLSDGTDVIVGVKVEFSSNASQEDTLNLHVEWATDNDSAAETESWRDALERMMRYGLNLDELQIKDSTASWVLYVDALILDNSGGNVLDCLSIAAKAALADTKIPKVNVTSLEEGQWDVEVEEDPESFTTLNVSKFPICVTLLAITQEDTSYFIVDPLEVEEQYMESRLIVATNSDGKICSIQKTKCGDSSKGLPMQLLQTMIQTAQRIGIEISKRLDILLKVNEKLST